MCISWVIKCLLTDSTLLTVTAVTNFHTPASSEPNTLHSHPQNPRERYVSFLRGRNVTQYFYRPQNQTQQGKIQTLVSTHIFPSPYVTSCTFIQLFPSLYPYLLTNYLAFINPLTPNDPYRGRTAPLTSKHCILYIYSSNIGTEYFKRGIYAPSFFFNAVS